MVQQTSFQTPGPTPTDELLLTWLTEAADYEIRYVPATLPDLLKTDEVIRFERERGARRRPDGHRHDRHPPCVGATPRHGHGVLLVDAGDHILHAWRGDGSGSAQQPGVTSSTG